MDSLILGLVFGARRRVGWWAALAVSLGLLGLFVVSIAMVVGRGIGVWGLNVPVAWGFAIVNFVWWIGIGHAGTFISAILFVSEQSWRASINRFTEAMTLFAVACAGVFPLLHLGRIGVWYYLLPYPNDQGLWPQWRSPLMWDFIAILSYGTVSALFWFLGLVPDLARFRDRAPKLWQRRVFGLLALGWRGSSSQWIRYGQAYLLLGGLATALVVSVHSIVSMDFAISLNPGWHSTIFPPYFVAGAIFSGFAMVVTLLVPLRRMLGLGEWITLRHFDNMGKILLLTSLVVTHGYFMEAYLAWHSGDPQEMELLRQRLSGDASAVFWATIVFNSLLPQILWASSVRRNLGLLFVLSLLINVGMWLERYLIVVSTLEQRFLPASWGAFSGSFWDWGLFVGSFGLFFTLLLLFVRALPVVSLHEMKEHLAHETKEGGSDG
ncbi:NrfD/PsrC family molybdoenzyme membrane anchor subunit [Pelagicoccus sp. SDUM812005]|uniref:NrfD/PsrC family molybdoenzyme membrane anchor subunit n=1 Tax=Pelagicoccus sp. SDUM812005 TaxID=3041257 RepID=UPI002811EFBA|nr:NrfD/PsrC family molybdoenzyme membrane anchor subunit [Pelagicoccus sp. SDUM812005]